MFQIFTNYVKQIFSVKAEDDDLIDPQDVLRAECKETKHCVELYEKLQSCNDRVNSRTKTAEICTEELFDYLHAIDHCVTPQLMSKLK